MTIKKKFGIVLFLILSSITVGDICESIYIDASEIILQKKKKPNFKEKSLEHFLYSLAQRESGNDWTVYNKYGYVGKYQFGDVALRDLGYGDCFSFEEFKKDPSVFPEWLQDNVIIDYIKRNKSILSKYIKKYKGNIINDILITESGIIAAAHLVGSGNTIKWFENNGEIDITDSNGVSITHYLELFKGYKISI